MKDWVTFLGGNFKYLGKKKRENAKLYVKLRKFELMTKNGHQKFRRMKRFFRGKVRRKSVTCEIVLDSLKISLK